MEWAGLMCTAVKSSGNGKSKMLLHEQAPSHSGSQEWTRVCAQGPVLQGLHTAIWKCCIKREKWLLSKALIYHLSGLSALQVLIKCREGNSLLPCLLNTSEVGRKLQSPVLLRYRHLPPLSLLFSKVLLKRPWVTAVWSNYYTWTNSGGRGRPISWVRGQPGLQSSRRARATQRNRGG